jgi:glycosyltransferase involved in cell wall biosynthesis
VRRQLPKGVRILLHQHNNAAAAMGSGRWRRLGASLDGIVFVAEAARRTAEAAHGRLPVRTWVVHNGIDHGHFSSERWFHERAKRREALGAAAGDAVIASVGRIVPGKGIAETAEAFIAMSRADARLLIVGDLDRSLYADALYTERIRDAAAKSGGRITLAGAVPQSDLPGWYCAADVVIVPSVAAEGLPKTITEALAMGKPCLTSDRGGARELIRDGVNGWIIPDPVTQRSIRDGMVRAIAEFRRLSPAASPVDISLEGMVRRFEQILGGDTVDKAAT